MRNVQRQGAQWSPPQSRRDDAPICFILAPSEHGGGGMGRVKDYIMQAGGDRYGRIRFVALDTRGTGNAAWSVFLTAGAIIRILATALTGRVAFVHVNVGHRGSFVRKTIAILLLRLGGIKVVLHLHAGGLMEKYPGLGGPIRAFVRIPFHAATCCVVLGNEWRTWLIRTIGVDPRKVEVVYNGVPLGAAPPIERLGRHVACRQLLFLGNLLEAKGLSELLAAVARLPVSVGNWRLTVAGAGDIHHWKARAEALGIADRVSFPGWVDQAAVRTFLAEADVLLLPSHYEALPLVVLEALGMGTPVICTPVGVLPEILTDMHTAVFVRPRDVPDLTDKLQHLLRDPTLRQTLARNGRALFEQKFTLAAFIRNLFDVYRRHCGIDIEMARPSPPREGVENARQPSHWGATP